MIDSALDLVIAPAAVLLAAHGKPTVFAGCVVLAAAGALFPLRRAPLAQRRASMQTEQR